MFGSFIYNKHNTTIEKFDALKQNKLIQLSYKNEELFPDSLAFDRYELLFSYVYFLERSDACTISMFSSNEEDSGKAFYHVARSYLMDEDQVKLLKQHLYVHEKLKTPNLDAIKAVLPDFEFQDLRFDFPFENRPTYCTIGSTRKLQIIVHFLSESMCSQTTYRGCINFLGTAFSLFWHRNTIKKLLASIKLKFDAMRL